MAAMDQWEAGRGGKWPIRAQHGPKPPSPASPDQQRSPSPALLITTLLGLESQVIRCWNVYLLCIYNQCSNPLYIVQTVQFCEKRFRCIYVCNVHIHCFRLNSLMTSGLFSVQFNHFLAPTGAQGVTMSVRLSVCPSVRHSMLKTSLEQSIFIFLGQRAIKSIKIRVIQSEP